MGLNSPACNMSVWAAIEHDISQHSGADFCGCKSQSIGGGCINSAYRLSANNQHYFVKTNTADKIDMFAAEAAGLEEIISSQSVRAPKPLCWGSDNNSAYIVMEYIAFGAGAGDSAGILGRQLAQMHRHTHEQFGWQRDNTIGSTPQLNSLNKHWVTFLREQRLGYQLRRAANAGYGGALQKKGERLLADLDTFFDNYSPDASLLHGDLWSGNYASDSHGQPVIFDPATYYGDREADLAMTELFGGFGADFYAAYREAYPMDQGYPVRKTLYNLYQILNHLNLFGGGYQAQAEQMIDSLLSHIR